MKLPFVAKNSEERSWTSSSWGWPSCYQPPRTLSFRANSGTDIFKVINSAYLDLDFNIDRVEVDEDSRGGGDPIESVIRGLRSDRRRLFFEPGEGSSSILEAKAGGSESGFEDSVVLSMESRDPYLDFRSSMEEMMQAHPHALNHPRALHQLLSCYLRLNANTNHPYILAAFVDLLVALPFPISASVSSSSHDSPSPSPSSLLSFSASLSSSFSTPCVRSCLEADDEDQVDTTPTPTSSFMLQQVKEDISQYVVHQHEASSSNA